MLWGGGVADPSRNDESTQMLREMNTFAANDKRVMYTLLPIGDGTGLAFKLWTADVQYFIDMCIVHHDAIWMESDFLLLATRM